MDTVHEEVVGGDRTHGAVVARLTTGAALLHCRCGRLVHSDRWRGHIAAHRREHVVWRTSMEVNAAPRDRAVYERLDPVAAQAIAAMTPKKGGRRGPRK